MNRLPEMLRCILSDRFFVFQCIEYHENRKEDFFVSQSVNQDNTANMSDVFLLYPIPLQWPILRCTKYVFQVLI